MGVEHIRRVTPAEGPVVLYIGGEGRSGSTLLSAMLGQYPGLLPVGELRGIWQAVLTNELCGCGNPFGECMVWQHVGAQAFGGWDQVDLDEMVRLDAAFGRHRFVGRLIVPTLRRRHAKSLDRYLETLGKLYAALGQVSGGSVIVDSTKDPAYAFVLGKVGGIDLRVVHLVRDSRAVAYSWSKTGIGRPEYARHPTLSGTFMDRRASWRAALEWDGKNALFHYLSHTGVPRILVRYEALLENPACELRRALALAGIHDVAPASSGEYESLPHHTLGGNRIRFARGVVRLRADDEWRGAMSRGRRFTVSALTLPLLLDYGYVGRAMRTLGHASERSE
jgi:sulfotransferase family protein